MVTTDKDELGHVVSNLLSNAIKYSHKETVIMVTCQLNGNKTLVAVQHESKDIEQHDQDELIDRYYQVNLTRRIFRVWYQAIFIRRLYYSIRV